MKKYIIIGAIMLAMCVAISILWNMYSAEKRERQRQESNVTVLNDSVKHSTIRDSLNVASISALNYTVDELKKYRAENLQIINDLKIKKKNVESIIKVGTLTKDTLRKEDLIPIPNKPDCLRFKDKWSDITTCHKDSTVEYHYTDSLDVIVDKVPKHKILWWSWGTKGYKVNVVNFNPHSTINYLEYIRVEK
jgi:hypothetical protein